MKKIILLIVAFISMQMYSQEQFNIGINGGIPIGNIESVSNFAFGADVNYLFEVSQDFLVGPSVGLVFFNTEDLDGLEVDSLTFLPISASLYFNSAGDKFYVGGEVGYAVSISDADSGFFIKPTIGYHLNDSFKLNAFYAGVKTSAPTFGYIGLGLAFDFNGRKNGLY